MPTNDQILLDEFLEQGRRELRPDTSESAFFEFFAAEQALKDFDLSYDELDSGLVGKSRDGGIDGIYVLVNGDLVQEDDYTATARADASLDLILVQAKRRQGFQETPVERFITSSEDLLDLAKDLDELRDLYDAELIEAIDRFRSVQKQLVKTFPKLRVTYFYATRGLEPSASVRAKVSKLESVVRRLFSAAEFHFKFLGAPDLLSLARQLPRKTYELTLAENPISSGAPVGFACLVKLRAYYDFITDGRGVLQRQVFEANVRDHQGPTQVNQEIRASLRHPHTEDFWWLNNGISILASRASFGGKTLTIEDPQIVNGLQTSMEIYNYFRSLDESDRDENDEAEREAEQRSILVRVIVPDDTGSRDRIIRATNSQTSVQPASLRATDKVHRDIEEYFIPRGLYYDRRKNYYKNRSKPRSKIVGIPYLAQSVMAIVLQRPDTARARPSSLLKEDSDYERIYSERYPIRLYYVCAAGMRRVEEVLKSMGQNLEKEARNNLKFYIGMHVFWGITTSDGRDPKEVASLELEGLCDEMVRESCEAVRAAYKRLGGTDQVAKGPELLKALKEAGGAVESQEA